MWEGLLAMAENPILGFGFESFWTGDRREIALERWFQHTQAHNGYLETYLNLGLVGLLLLLGWFLSGIRNVRRELVIDYPAAMLRLSFIVVVALYNWTEATFYGINNMWVVLLLGIMDVSGEHNSTSADAGSRQGQSRRWTYPATSIRSIAGRD
jgi:O-antigen ligase